MQRWRNAITQLHWVYEGAVPRNGNGPQDIATDYYAWLLLEGEAYFSFEGCGGFTLMAGQWGFPPPYARGRFHRFSPDARLLSLRFRLELPGGKLPFEMKSFLCFESSLRPALEREARELARRAKGFLDTPLNREVRDYDLGRHAAIQASFWRWLGLWKEAMEAEGLHEADVSALDERIERMLAVLKGVRAFGSVPYRRLEEASSLGRVQIDRLFKAQLGNSPKTVMERHILDLCRERLRSSNISAKELSAELGFPHPANFSAWFRRRAGLPPQRFRESP